MEYPSKSALIAAVRDLMSRHSIGATLAGKDFDFCLELFRFHPDAATKLASGVTAVEVRRDQYGNKHFQIHRADGTDDDISWVHCIRHLA